MQVLSALLVAFLVFNTIDARHHHHEEEHEFEHRNSSLQTRGLLDGIFSSGCKFICGSSDQPTTPSVASWLVDLSGQASIGVIVAFEGNTKSLAFINISKKIVVIFTGNKEVFGVFNLQTNSGLIINISSGLAIYVRTASTINLFIGSNVNIYAGVYALANVVTANQASVTGLISILLQGPLVFNFQTFMNNLTSGSIDLIAFFSGKLSLYNSVRVDFGALFSAVTTSVIVTGGYSFSFGVLNVITAITGNVAGVSYGFLSIIQRFSSSLDGFVNGNLLYQLFSQISLYSQAFISGRITGVSLLSDLSLSFTASGSLLFAVTVNGLITVGGAIKGTVSEATSIAGSIIGAANIGVGVSFQAGIALSTSLSG